jgi:hypothetical protein
MAAKKKSAKRSAAAKKAAATRKRNHARRVAAGKKAAATRKRRGRATGVALPSFTGGMSFTGMPAGLGLSRGKKGKKRKAKRRGRAAGSIVVGAATLTPAVRMALGLPGLGMSRGKKGTKKRAKRRGRAVGTVARASLGMARGKKKQTGKVVAHVTRKKGHMYAVDKKGDLREYKLVPGAKKGHLTRCGPRK